MHCCVQKELLRTVLIVIHNHLIHNLTLMETSSRIQYCVENGGLVC